MGEGLRGTLVFCAVVIIAFLLLCSASNGIVTKRKYFIPYSAFKSDTTEMIDQILQNFKEAGCPVKPKAELKKNKKGLILFLVCPVEEA